MSLEVRAGEAARSLWRIAIVGLVTIPAMSFAQFERDSRLDAVVSVRSNAGTVKSVLESLSKTTGVELRVDASIENDLVILVCKERNASSVLSKIAEHFDWNWKKEDKAYLLYPSDEQKKKEQAELRKQILEPYQKLRESSKKYLKVLEATNLEEARRERDRLETILGSSGDDALLRRILELDRLTQPAQSVFHDVCSRLTEAHFEALERDGRIILSTHPKPGQFAYPGDRRLLDAELKQLVGAITEQLELARQSGKTPPGAFAAFENAQITGARVLVIRTDDHSGRETETSWKLLPESNGMPLPPVAETGLSTSRLGEYDPPSNPAGLKLDEFEDVSLAREWVEPFLRISYEGDRYLTSADPDYWVPGSQWKEPLEPLGELLTEMFSRCDMDLILDAYDVLYRTTQELEREPRTIKMLLQFVHARMPIQVHHVDGWWSVRASRRAFERYRTVERRVLIESVTREARDRGWSLDHKIWLASSLNDYQMFLWFRGDMSSGTEVYALRMLGEMGPTGRGTVLAGGSLPYVALTPKGMAHFRRVLMSHDFIPFGILTTEAEMASGVYARNEWYGSVIRGFDWEDITDVHPSGIPGDAFVSIQGFQYPGAALRRKTSAKQQRVVYVQSYALAALRTAESAGDAGPDLEFAATASADLVINCRASEQFARGAIVRTSVRSSEFGAYDQLPESFRRTIESQAEKYRAMMRGGGGGNRERASNTLAWAPLRSSD